MQTLEEVKGRPVSNFVSINLTHKTEGDKEKKRKDKYYDMPVSTQHTSFTLLERREKAQAA